MDKQTLNLSMQKYKDVLKCTDALKIIITNNPHGVKLLNIILQQRK